MKNKTQALCCQVNHGANTSWVKLNCLLILVLIGYNLGANAQNENSNWYFGHKAGISFNSGKVFVKTDGQLDTREGCASISDGNGSLLFYTDGITVYTRLHTVMWNGNSLGGDPSSSQSAVVVRLPGSKDIYYLFTVDDIGSVNGMMYSIVDMRLRSGLGEVTTKNTRILSKTCEKISVVKHSNKVDYWVITHEFGTDKFYSYLFDKNGISSTPVITSIGATINGSSSRTIGYLKSSPDSRRIVCVNYYLNVELFDFDNSTGKLSNVINIDYSATGGFYGAEFSRNSNVLYVSDLNSGSLQQFNLVSGDEAKIKSSRFITPIIKGYIGALQLGPDNKIYLAPEGSGYLSVIESPDSLGAKANFVFNKISLMVRTAGLGLPTFISTRLTTINFTSICYGEATEFGLSAIDMDSVQWNFNDVASGNLNYSNELKPHHIFSKSGDFDVQAIVFFAGVPDTITKTISIFDTRKNLLGRDTAFCFGDSLVLSASTFAAPYLWQDASTKSTLKVKNAGIYWVEIIESNCKIRDSIKISINMDATFKLPNDTTLCMGDSLTLDVTLLNATYKWSDLTTNSTLIVKNPVFAWVDVTVDKCTFTDSILVKYNNNPTVKIGADTIICAEHNFVLRLKETYDKQFWSDNSTEPFLDITQPGKYSIEVLRNNCAGRDTIDIKMQKKPVVFLPELIDLCDVGSVSLYTEFPGSTYLWHNQTTESSYVVKTPGLVWVAVTNKCGETRDSSIVTADNCTCIIEIPNAFTPNLDVLNDEFLPITTGCNFTDYSFQIFNRWGEQIFYTTNPNQGWDGMYLNKLAPDAVYSYLVRGTTFRREKEQRFGTVTVLR